MGGVALKLVEQPESGMCEVECDTIAKSCLDMFKARVGFCGCWVWWKGGWTDGWMTPTGGVEQMTQPFTPPPSDARKHTHYTHTYTYMQ